MNKNRKSLEKWLSKIISSLRKQRITLGLVLELLAIAISIVALKDSRSQFNTNLENSRPMVFNELPNLRFMGLFEDSLSFVIQTKTVNAGARAATDVTVRIKVVSFNKDQMFYKPFISQNSQRFLASGQQVDKTVDKAYLPRQMISKAPLDSTVNTEAIFYMLTIVSWNDEVLEKSDTWKEVAWCRLTDDDEKFDYRILSEEEANKLQKRIDKIRSQNKN